MPLEFTPPAKPENDSIDLMQYLEVFARQKKLIFISTVIAFSLSIVVALLLPKIYSSTARILPPQQDQGIMGMMLGQLGGGVGPASFIGSVLGAGSSADQFVSILESEAVRDAIIDRFKLMEEYKKDYRLDMYKKMEKLVEVKAGKKDGIITITVEDEDPKRAADIANGYIDELGKLVARMGMTNAEVNKVYLEQRLAKARADLSQAEDAMKAFQTKNKTIDISGQAKAAIEGIAMLKAQIVSQEAQLAGMRSQLTESAQEVRAIRETINKLKSQVASMEGKGTGVIPSFGSVPQIGQEAVRLLRELKVQETIVELLTKQYELAKLSEAKEIVAVQVIQKAMPPDKKIKPKRTLLVLSATTVAFFLSLSYAVVVNYIILMPPRERQRWQRIWTLLTGRTVY